LVSLEVKQAVATINTVRERGLEDVLSLESWRLRQDALTAMLDCDAQLAEQVIASRYELSRRVRAA
jgi:hypothetical protein